MDEKLKKYPKTENFSIDDVIPVPHSFMITQRHVAYASDKWHGMLGKETINELESQMGKPSCGVRGCNLMYDQHELALAVKYKIDDKEALKAYLTKEIAEMAEKDGYAGFVFVKC